MTLIYTMKFLSHKSLSQPINKYKHLNVRFDCDLVSVFIIYDGSYYYYDRLCGLVVRVLGYRSGGPGSVPGTTRKKSSASSAPRTGSTQPREYN
jgi:hypothetical protein